MLYISLIASGLLLCIANWIVRRSRRPGTAVGCTSLVFLVGVLFAMCVLPAVAIQAVLIGAAARSGASRVAIRPSFWVCLAGPRSSHMAWSRGW